MDVPPRVARRLALIREIANDGTTSIETEKELDGLADDVEAMFANIDACVRDVTFDVTQEQHILLRAYDAAEKQMGRQLGEIAQGFGLISRTEVDPPREYTRRFSFKLMTIRPGVFTELIEDKQSGRTRKD